MKQTIWIIVLFCLTGFLGCGNDKNNDTQTPGGGGSQPTITGVTPSSVSIGQVNGEASVFGTNFSGVTSVVLGDGITVNTFNSISATQINVNFSVNPNAVPGARSVVIAATSGSGSSSTALTVSSNHAPKASFKIDPPSGSKDTLFTLDATSTVDVENNGIGYAWDFGDGKSAQGKKVTHKFGVVGDFTIKLRAFDNSGAFSVNGRALEVSKNAPPVARLKVLPGLSGSTGTVFTFDASASNDPDGKVKDWQFVFGDGTRAHGKSKVDHTFKNEGSYDVSLTVTDNTNQSSVPATERIKVEKNRETVCAGNGGGHASIIKGRVIAVEPGQWAIVSFGGDHNCGNTWHKCDDFRRLNPEGFYGIVDKMTDRGSGVMGVHNACPYRWPPSIGEGVFVYLKTCAINHCP